MRYPKRSAIASALAAVAGTFHTNYARCRAPSGSGKGVRERRSARGGACGWGGEMSGAERPELATASASPRLPTPTPTASSASLQHRDEMRRLCERMRRGFWWLLLRLQSHAHLHAPSLPAPAAPRHHNRHRHRHRHRQKVLPPTVAPGDPGNPTFGGETTVKPHRLLNRPLRLIPASPDRRLHLSPATASVSPSATRPGYTSQSSQEHFRMSRNKQG
ncbi:hypothetical protein PG993_011413 [Apiospora rasikravindrae]|uniref:Secreted protein n=1 Tax=Apiospora rasikravindrae TaxID=990691 RepID=A0ABR1SE69_9PEZI